MSEAYCNSEEYQGDVSYCYLDLAVEKQDPSYCVGFGMWSSSQECLFYVNQRRKLTPDDCLVFDPGSSERQRCVDYVYSGIPSDPGLSYEDSLK